MMSRLAIPHGPEAGRARPRPETSRPFPRGLAVGHRSDPHEKEADRLAEAMLRDGPGGPARGCTCGGACPACRDRRIREESTTLRPARIGGGPPPSSEAPPVVHAALGTSGRPLDTETRSYFQPRLGVDLGDVRVHTDALAASSARSVDALAYTVGRDIVFASGRYAPATSRGRRLIAHELAHVLQGEADPSAIRPEPTPLPGGSIVDRLEPAGGVLRRYPECSLDHIKDECDNAGASCQAVQSNYCQKKYPKADDISRLHEKAVLGAESKKAGLPNAAGNLLHFLGGKGTEKTMTVDVFKTHSATKDQLANVHRPKFIDGATRRLQDGRLKAGGSVEMVWTDTANAFSFTEDDLGLAVGGYTICSKVKVSARDKGGGDVEVVFDDWIVQAFDCYNWDPGKAIGGLFGGVTDKDLCCLQNAGRGKHFRVRTDPWKNDHAPSMAAATISAGKTPPPASPPAPPKKPDKDDDR